MWVSQILLDTDKKGVSAYGVIDTTPKIRHGVLKK